MSFDPSALLKNVHYKSRDPKSKSLTTTLSKGKKRAREATRLASISWGQSLKNPTCPGQPTPQQQAQAHTPYFGSDFFTDNNIPTPIKSLEEYAECDLNQSIVDKYEKKVDSHERVRTLDLLTLKVYL